MPSIDDLLRCGICSSYLKDPYVLECNHTYCKACLESNTTAGKLTCRTCLREYAVSGGNVTKSFKPNTVIDFLMDYKNGNFKEMNDNDAHIVEGVCPECVHPAPKKVKEGEQPPPLPVVSLSKCFHCAKVLCQKCRNTHYETFRKKNFQLLEKLAEGSVSVKTTTGNK